MQAETGNTLDDRFIFRQAILLLCLSAKDIHRNDGIMPSHVFDAVDLVEDILKRHRDTGLYYQVMDDDYGKNLNPNCRPLKLKGEFRDEMQALFEKAEILLKRIQQLTSNQ